MLSLPASPTRACAIPLSLFSLTLSLFSLTLSLFSLSSLSLLSLFSLSSLARFLFLSLSLSYRRQILARCQDPAARLTRNHRGRKGWQRSRPAGDRRGQDVLVHHHRARRHETTRPQADHRGRARGGRHPPQQITTRNHLEEEGARRPQQWVYGSRIHGIPALAAAHCKSGALQGSALQSSAAK